MTESTAKRVATIVGQITAQDPDPEADGGASLRDLGVSSLRMIELIGTLETSFSIRIDDDEIDEDNFGTLAGLIRYVEEKTAG
ncbi:MAG: acyl carrier protein [Candidatus Eisenbacteria bacterium]